MKIDAHSHFFPPTLAEYIKKHSDKVNTEIVLKDGKEFVKHKEGAMYPLFEGFYSREKKLEDMERMGIDHSVLSVNPGCFYYWIDAGTAYETSRICNDWVAEFAAEDPRHFSGMATIPLQDIELSLKELKRAHEELGLNGLEIGPVINGRNIDGKEFFPIYKYCEKNNILISLHPYYIGDKENYTKYYNTNLVANVLETNMGINSLIFGGAIENYPGLKILCAHGGGFFPYQLGRLMHGYKVRKEPKENISKSPEHYLDSIYYDTITFWAPALEFLVNNFGADHVVIGTDYPYDMGDDKPVEHVNELRIDAYGRKQIYADNMKQLLGIKEVYR